MQVLVDHLAEGLELRISTTHSQPVVSVKVDGKQLGKMYIFRHGIIVAPGNANKDSGKLLTWDELSVGTSG